MRCDYLIVGSGLFGSVFAEQVKRKGKTVLVIDKREHIAGNVYSEKVEGIDVHKYGPHIFQTNNEDIWNYVNNFTKFNQYTHRVKANYQNKIYSFPINLMTLHQVYGVITPEEAQKVLDEVIIPCDNPKNMEEWCLSKIGPTLYEMFFKGYSIKQWRRHPSELPASISKRLPFRLNYDDAYHDKRFSGIPDNGYTDLVANILGNTKVELGVDFKSIKDWRTYADRLVYSGPIDEFFNYQFGELEYLTLEFKTKIMNQKNYQGIAQMNYTDGNIPWTRSIEHKHFNFKNQEKTVVTWEFPVDWEKSKTPYYPVNDSKNTKILNLYRQEAAKIKDVVLGGRLAQGLYLDMDQVIASAIKKVSLEAQLNNLPES